MQTLVHITAPVEEDLRSRCLARAIGEYMQDTEAHPGPEGEADTTGEELYPEEDPPQGEAGTHPETHTETQADTDGETEARTGTQTESNTRTQPDSEIESQPYSVTETETVTEAHPPPPQPSSTPFTSHITHTLSMLASRLPLHRFYRPAWQTRPLSVWERGYWLVSGPSVSGPSGSSTGTDISTDTGIGTRASTGTGTGTGTETEGTARLWPFISQIIQQGKAGWGVWAVKRSASSAVPNSTDHNQTQTHIQTHRQAQVQTQTQVQVQVYCWGQVVPYIYLLFLVGSNRRLTGYSLQWRDAADHIVVQM